MKVDVLDLSTGISIMIPDLEEYIRLKVIGNVSSDYGVAVEIAGDSNGFKNKISVSITSESGKAVSIFTMTTSSFTDLSAIGRFVDRIEEVMR